MTAKYIVYKDKPVGEPKLEDGSYLQPTPCKEGFFILIQHKNIAAGQGWIGVEVENIIPIEIEMI